MDTIATMPLNPRHAHKLGFYSLFAYAAHLGNLHKIPTTYILNEIGNEKYLHMSHTLCRCLSLLELRPEILLRDSEIENGTIALLLQGLLDKNFVQEATHSVSRCSCMNIQYATDATLRRTKTSLTSPYGTSLCCNTPIVEHQTPSLITKPLELLSEVPDIYPLWAQKEFVWFCHHLTGQHLLLSRLHERHIAVTTSCGAIYWLDNDVVGMCMSALLRAQGIDIRYLISGVSTVRQAALLCIFSTALGVKLPQEIHFLPRVHFEQHANSDIVQSVIARHGAQRVCNTLEWCAMSGRKDITLDANAFLRMSDKKVTPSHNTTQYRKQLLA